MVTYVDPKLCETQILVFDGKDIGEYHMEPFGIWAGTWTVYSYISGETASHIAHERDAREILIMMYQNYE
jgi:hypothetical protein